MPKAPLPRISREIANRYGVIVSYDKIYKATLNGILPIEQGANGRWYAEESALPEIARLLGIAVPEATAPAPARKAPIIDPIAA